MEQKNLNMTGFASQDKPWLKYYTDEQISEIAPKMTVYECMHANNKDHLDDIAFEYYGNKITYRKLFSNIDKAQKSFEEMGVKKGDIVTICSITTPEITKSFWIISLSEGT